MRTFTENTQMEMTLGNANEGTGCSVRQFNRAQWWFQRMRLVVDRALDRRPIPQPRPEQTWLPGAYCLHDFPAYRPSDFTRLENHRARG